MSEDTSKLLERIAALESQLAPARKSEGQPAFDKREAAINPIAYLKKMGMSVTELQHMSRHFVADALGKDCPPELSAMVQMGPQIAATSRMEELVNSLSRKVDELSNVHKVASVKTQTVDPVKYPTLAAAVKGDSSILERELAKLGDIADPAAAFKKIEEALAPYAKAFGFKTPATTVDSSTNNTTSIQNPDGSTITQEIKPASAFSGEVPSLLGSGSNNGAMTADEHERLKSAILKKHNLLDSK